MRYRASAIGVPGRIGQSPAHTGKAVPAGKPLEQSKYRMPIFVRVTVDDVDPAFIDPELPWRKGEQDLVGTARMAAAGTRGAMTRRLLSVVASTGSASFPSV